MSIELPENFFTQPLPPDCNGVLQLIYQHEGTTEKDSPMTAKKSPTATPTTVEIQTGDIVEHFLNQGEYYVLEVNSRTRMVKVLNIRTSGRGEMTLNAASFIRRPTEPEMQKITEMIDRWQEVDNPATLVPGTVCVWKKNDSATVKAMQKQGWDPKALLVVVKTSAKSVNVVPLGGHGDGMAYLRAHPSLLKTVELPTTTR